MQRYQATISDDVLLEVVAAKLTSTNVDEVSDWCAGQKVLEHDALDSTKTFVGLNVRTFMGMRRASEGDYVCQHASGEFTVQKPGIFEDMYEVK